MNEKLNPNTGRTIAEDLFELFRGDDERFGTFDPKQLRRNGDKMEMKDEQGRGPSDVKRPPTAADVQAHLDSKIPIGIWLARADGMTRRIVIDIDGKDQKGGYRKISQFDIAKKAERMGLPLVDSRSKSGGLHMDCFLTEWIPQATANALGRQMAVLLGFPKAEVFPPANGPGNWVILPYFSDLMCAIARPLETIDTAMMMPPEEYRDFAMASRVTPETLEAVVGEARPEKKAKGGPEYAKGKLEEFAAEIADMPEGGRSKLLYSRAKDMGKMVGAKWIQRDEVFNALMDAARKCRLSASEAMGHINNGLDDGEKEDPVVEGNVVFPEIEDGMIVWEGGEETEWEIPLKGWGSIRMPVSAAMNYRIFCTLCAGSTKLGGPVFQPMKEPEWRTRLHAARAEAEVRQVPLDETPKNLFIVALRVFIDKDKGFSDDKIERILDNCPVLMNEDNKIYFRFDGLIQHLDNFRSPIRTWGPEKLGRVMATIGKKGEDWGTTMKTVYANDKMKKRTINVRWILADFFNREIDEPRAPIYPPKSDPI